MGSSVTVAGGMAVLFCKYNAILDEKKRAGSINLGTALMTVMQSPTLRALFLLV